MYRVTKVNDAMVRNVIYSYANYGVQTHCHYLLWYNNGENILSKIRGYAKRLVVGTRRMPTIITMYSVNANVNWFVNRSLLLCYTETVWPTSRIYYNRFKKSRNPFKQIWRDRKLPRPERLCDESFKWFRHFKFKINRALVYWMPLLLIVFACNLDN